MRVWACAAHPPEFGSLRDAVGRLLADPTDAGSSSRPPVPLPAALQPRPVLEAPPPVNQLMSRTRGAPAGAGRGAAGGAEVSWRGSRAGPRLRWADRPGPPVCGRRAGGSGRRPGGDCGNPAATVPAPSQPRSDPRLPTRPPGSGAGLSRPAGPVPSAGVSARLGFLTFALPASTHAAFHPFIREGLASSRAGL